MSALLRVASFDSLRGIVFRGDGNALLAIASKGGRHLSATTKAAEQQRAAAATSSSSNKRDEGGFTSEDEEGFSSAASSSSGPPPPPPSAGVTVAAMGMGGERKRERGVVFLMPLFLRRSLPPFDLSERKTLFFPFSSPLFSSLLSNWQPTAAGAVAVVILGVFGVFQMAGAVARGTGRSIVASEGGSGGGGGGTEAKPA